jgi:hypothetical protein
LAQMIWARIANPCTNPILVGEEGDLIAGHGRLCSGPQARLTEVPVIPLHGLTELQRRQLVLADNRIALNAGWDLDMLQLELRDLATLGADLSVLGFTGTRMARMLPAISATCASLCVRAFRGEGIRRSIAQNSKRRRFANFSRT